LAPPTVPEGGLADTGAVFWWSWRAMVEGEFLKKPDVVLGLPTPLVGDCGWHGPGIGCPNANRVAASGILPSLWHSFKM
jgi:hypothetical protein